MANSPALRVEHLGAVLWITLDNPPVNALEVDMVQTLRAELDAAAASPDVRCVVLAAAGRFFSAGQHVKTIAQATPEQVQRAMVEIYNPVIVGLRTLRKPVLAALNGPAAGAGLGLALAADLRLASKNARFVFGFSALGLTADAGLSVLLPGLIGYSRAMALALLEQPITAEQAQAVGLVSEVVAEDELEPHTKELATRLAAGPTAAYAATKEAFNRAAYPHLQAALDEEARAQAALVVSDDGREGVLAFLQKRIPAFVGH